MPNSGTCKRSSYLSATHWIPKTGNVTGIAYTLARGCATPPTGNGYASASASDSFQVAIPVRIFTSASYNFTVGWSFDVTLLATIAGRAVCPNPNVIPGKNTYNYCNAYVDAGTWFSMELYDQTNSSSMSGPGSSVLGPLNWTAFYNYSSCGTTGVCSSSNVSTGCLNPSYSTCVASGSTVSGRNTTYVDTGKNCVFGFGARCMSWNNWTLSPGHKYWVLASVYFYSDAYLLNYGAGTTASGSINGGTLGNTGWKITSVTVS